MVSADYSDFADLWGPLEAGVGPGGAYVLGRSPDERATLRSEFQRRLGVADDPFRLTARAWLVTGRVA
jgi:hypothetical protein